MMHKVCAIYDSKAGSYMPPFTSPTVGLAIREFSKWCSDPQLPMYQFPEDFALYVIGEFDNGLGVLTAEKPSIISKALEHVKKDGKPNG